MIDITREQYWEEKFEGNKEPKMSFSNKIIMIGLIIFTTSIIINTILIYNFFNLLNKL